MKYVAASIGLHVVLLAFLLLLPGASPSPLDEIAVNVVIGEAGAAGVRPGSLDGGGATDVAPAAPDGNSPDVDPPRDKPVPRPAAADTRDVAASNDRPPAVSPPMRKPRAHRRQNRTAETVARADVGSSHPGSGGDRGRPSGVGQARAGTGAALDGRGTGSGDDYFDRLRRWLARYQRYPEEALKKKQAGTVHVAFVIARDGTVLHVTIERSSGYPLLDRAVTRILHEASPVPPLPDDVKGAHATIAMPIAFRLGTFDRMF